LNVHVWNKSGRTLVVKGHWEESWTLGPHSATTFNPDDVGQDLHIEIEDPEKKRRRRKN